MHLLALSAFNDNYIWMLHDGVQALVVDPGDARPVIDALERLSLRLACILVTHHHADHVGGVKALQALTGAAIYAPHDEPLPTHAKPCTGGDEVDTLGLKIRVLSVPGHTLGHLAYLVEDPMPDEAPILFCGDTLFSGGCGRIFEGSPAQMLASLQTLSRLPGTTRVCCAHEYTLSNLRFAKTIEPANAELAGHQAWCEGQRAAGQPTLPSRLALELQINPFLRCEQPTVRQSVRAHLETLVASERPCAIDDDSTLATFTALRHWKNLTR